MMFRATFRNTLITILRSALFWIAFAALAVITMPTVWERPIYAEGFEHLAPTTLSFVEYNQHIGNVIASSFLVYALPVFSVILTVLVLNRDYGDQFFEIEKAAGAKPIGYIAGRLSAIITLQIAVVFLWGSFLLHAYVIGWGGVDELSFWAYLLNSTVQMLRWTLACVLPCMLFYVGLTYVIGTISQSGLVAAFGGFGYVILYMIMLMFQVKLTYIKGNKAAILYYDYLCHIPGKLKNYLFFYEVKSMWADDTSLGKAALCVAFLAVCFVIFAEVSYRRIRKREI